MQTEKLNINKKGILYLVLVVFFIVIISTAGGSLQSKKVASSSVNNLALAGLNFSIAGNDYSFKGSQILNGAKVVGEYSCQSSKCSGFVNIQSFFGTQKVELSASCTSGSCIFTAMGKEWKLNKSQIAQLRKLTGVPEKTQIKPGTNTDHKTNPKTKNPKVKTDQCNSLKTIDGKCRNKCSTTYVKGQPVRTEDCLRSSGSRDNPVYKAIDKLNECIQQKTGESQWDLLNKAICYVDNPAKAIKEGNSADGANKVALTASEQGKLYVPLPCLSLLRKVEALKKAGIEKGKKAGSVSEKDGEKCAYNGSAVCLFDTIIKKYKCTAKANGTSSVTNIVDTSNPNATTTSQDQCSGSFTDKIKCIVQNMLQGGGNGQPGNGSQVPTIQSPSQPSIGGGGGGGACQQGYRQSQNGSCIKNGSGVDIPKVQCLIVANKERIKSGEPVIIRWRTANADYVNIDGVGSGLANNDQKTLTPTNTTTYKLLAYGKGDNNTKTCGVTVNVDSNVVVPNKSAIPRILCKLPIILKGKESEVSWECPTVAYSSKGSGINTEGKMSGSKTISPKYNTKYSVFCLDKNKKEIGKNSCAVTVGNPQYDIIVYPTSAKPGDRVRVSWASLFMNRCRVRGPLGFDYSKKSGVVITEPFAHSKSNSGIKAAVYNIECESQFGGTVSKDVVVKFKK